MPQGNNKKIPWDIKQMIIEWKRKGVNSHYTVNKSKCGTVKYRKRKEKRSKNEGK